MSREQVCKQMRGMSHSHTDKGETNLLAIIHHALMLTITQCKLAGEQQQHQQPTFDPFALSDPVSKQPDSAEAIHCATEPASTADHLNSTVAGSHNTPELQLYSVRRSEGETGDLGTAQVQRVFEAYVIGLLAHI